MPRRLRLPTREVGAIELYLIYQYGEAWEPEWLNLQGLMDLPCVSKEDMDHALHGYTQPLVSQLGPSPKGKLLLLPQASRECAQRGTCVLYDRTTCQLLHRKLPWCFQPAGIGTHDDSFSGTSAELAAEVVKLWREGAYVLVVRE